jgi:hypothetical protein
VNQRTAETVDFGDGTPGMKPRGLRTSGNSPFAEPLMSD